jgi:hypothetical protein
MQPASKYVVHSGHLMETLGFHLILTGFELFNRIVSCSLHLSQESYAYDNSCAVEGWLQKLGVLFLVYGQFWSCHRLVQKVTPMLTMCIFMQNWCRGWWLRVSVCLYSFSLEFLHLQKFWTTPSFSWKHGQCEEWEREREISNSSSLRQRGEREREKSILLKGVQAFSNLQRGERGDKQGHRSRRANDEKCVNTPGLP